MDEFRPMELRMMGCQVRLVDLPGLPITRVVAEDAGAGHAGYSFPRRRPDGTAADDLMAYVMEQARWGRRRFRVEADGSGDVALGVTFGLALLFGAPGASEQGALGGDLHGHLQRAYDRWRGGYLRKHRPRPGTVDK